MIKKDMVVKITLIAVALILFLSAAVWLLIPKREEVIIPEDVAKPLLTMLSTEYTYNVVEKGKKFKNIAIIKKTGNNYQFKSTEKRGNQKDIVVDAKLNVNYETLEWKLDNPRKNIKVTAVRSGNKIILSGTFEQKQNNKREIYIDDRKWLQVYQLGVMKFAASGKKDTSFEFWSLNPDDPGSAMVLFATNKGPETMNIDGVKIKTARLKIGLAGIMSMFWTGDYWFRVPEGVFVKAKISGDMAVLLKGEKKKK